MAYLRYVSISHFVAPSTASLRNGTAGRPEPLYRFGTGCGLAAQPYRTFAGCGTASLCTTTLVPTTLPSAGENLPSAPATSKAAGGACSIVVNPSALWNETIAWS